MNQKNLAAFGVPAFIFLVFMLNSFFIVSQMQQAIVLQFGEMVHVIRQPGLKMKIPFVQDVIYYDKRMLDFDVSETEVTLGDQKRVMVDTFTRYRIVDPAKFYKTVRNEPGVQARLSALITGTLRSVLGHTPLGKLLSNERTTIMHQIREKVHAAAQGLGIEVVEVRMKRADLPKENSQAVFNRMISARQTEAAEIRAKGKEISEVIRANTDRECMVIAAEAQKEAQILIGEGEAEAARLYREAYGQSPEFAFLYRTLEAYKVALTGQDTTYILSPENDFLKFFRKDGLKEMGIK